jgi:hypothetical protein
MFVPDGDAHIALQRQFYVSEGFTCEQAIAATADHEDADLSARVHSPP